MDISTLFTDAKTQLLANGDYPPTLWVEFSDAAGQAHLGLYAFAEFGADTALEEQQQFFAHGADFGIEHGRVDIASLVFISEAWQSFVKHSEREAFKRQYGRPEHDPQRREYLVASIVTLEPEPSGKPAIKQRIERAEIEQLRRSPATAELDLCYGAVVTLEIVPEQLACNTTTMQVYRVRAGGWSAEMPPRTRSQKGGLPA